MAVADPLRVPVPHGPSFQTQPFDIDLLCAKLEVAKLEQDSERARQRLRQLTSGDRDSVVQKDRQNETPPQFSQWGSSTHSTEKARPRFSPDARRTVHPKQLFTAVSVGRSDSGQSHNTSHFPVRSPRATGPDEYSHRNSGDDDLQALRLQQRSEMPKRKPVARTSESQVNTTSQRQSVFERPRSRETANRRSKTFPLQACKLPLKHHSMTAYEYADVKGRKSPPPRASTTTTSSYDPPESPMGLVNEYTISFDLADYNTEYSKPSKRQEKPQCADGLRSKSLLSLPLLMKKDRAQVKTEEVNISPPEESPVSPLRPSTAANNAWHARQQSLPVDFGNAGFSTQRPRLADAKESKRRSFVGWLKKL